MPFFTQLEARGEVTLTKFRAHAVYPSAVLTPGAAWSTSQLKPVINISKLRVPRLGRRICDVLQFVKSLSLHGCPFLSVIFVHGIVEIQPKIAGKVKLANYGVLFCFSGTTPCFYTALILEFVQRHSY